MRAKMQETKRERNKGGRPPGSKNKAKPLIPKELAQEMLDVLKPILPESDYDRIRSAIHEGKAISTLAEAKITLKLMGPSIWYRLLAEARIKKPKKNTTDPDLAGELGIDDEEDMVRFDRDLNERLKIYQNFLDMINKWERLDAGQSDTKAQPLIEVVKRSGFNGERFSITIGDQYGSVDRNLDEAGGEDSTVGAFSDQVPQRQIIIEDRQQIPAVRLLNDSERRSDPFRRDEEELQR